MRIALQDQGVAMPDVSKEYSPEIVQAGGAFGVAPYKYSKLPLRLFEAARMATAMINGCTVCMNWRAARDITYLGLSDGVTKLGPEPDEAFYQSVLNEDYEALTDKERLAVRYVQKMGKDPVGLGQDEAMWKEMKAAFTDAEIVDLTYSCAAWMGMGRAQHVLGIDAACVVPTHQQAEAA